ncbi:Dimeric alpha-beta barrel [Hahella sp. NBU794]|uniref:Dimeric alpha-beta barrel n=1 Tax=Hahella sp. NBU794 TaxID=3422590 RepID=UPI003D6E3030
MTVSIFLDDAGKDLEKRAAGKRVALVFHLKIKRSEDYLSWLRESANQCGGERLFRVQADPVAREGMWLDEILIDEFPSPKAALSFMATHGEALRRHCESWAVLAVVPESPWLFRMVRWMSRLIQVFKGVRDTGTPAAGWAAENTAIWPDQAQMAVARSQSLDDPLFVYNLNKYKAVAEYQGEVESEPSVSGKEAYDRYAKLAGFELMRRGAFPVYGGTPVCLLAGEPDCMLQDNWDKFIFVRYPQRRNLLATIEGDAFGESQKHRDAGLARVAIFMASPVGSS